MCYKEFSYMHCYIHAALTFLTINLQRPLQIIHCDKYYEGKVRDALKLYKKCPIQIREEEGTGALAKLSQPGRSCSFEEAHLTASRIKA